jgi:Inorganic pyrophosphatase
MSFSFTDSRSYIGQTVTAKIDRAFGSQHPKHGFIYPVNYGYVPDTTSGDGEELDCYILGVFEPVEEFTGQCIAVIHRTDDDDDKLVLANKNYSDDAIEALTEFQERFFQHEIWR